MDKNALITGCSKGIGKTITLELANKGYNIIIYWIIIIFIFLVLCNYILPCLSKYTKKLVIR